MRTLTLLLLVVSPPVLKPVILRWLLGARVGRGVRIGWLSAVTGRSVRLGDYCEIRALSLVRCDGAVEIGAYSAISNLVLVYGSASFRVGDRCYVGPQCLINADEDVSLGNLSALGPRCMVYTHGAFLPYTEGYWVRFGPVSLGERVWVAAGVFIHPGVTVGDHVFVNSGAVVTRDVEPGRVVEGQPAAPIAATDALKRRMTPARLDAAARQMLERFRQSVLERGLGLEVASPTAGELSFRHRGRSYRVSLVPSDGATAEAAGPAADRWIALVTRPGWGPPPGAGPAILLDLTTMTTRPTRDPIARRLWRFLRSYYGVVLEYETSGRRGPG